MLSSLVHHVNATMGFVGGVFAAIVTLAAVGSRLLRQAQWRLAQIYAAIHGARQAVKGLEGQLGTCGNDSCPFRQNGKAS